MMVMCTKQHLSNIWNSIHEKVMQHWGSVEKSVVHKRSAYIDKYSKQQEVYGNVAEIIFLKCQMILYRVQNHLKLKFKKLFTQDNSELLHQLK